MAADAVFTLAGEDIGAAKTIRSTGDELRKLTDDHHKFMDEATKSIRAEMWDRFNAATRRAGQEVKKFGDETQKANKKSRDYNSTIQSMAGSLLSIIGGFKASAYVVSAFNDVAKNTDIAAALGETFESLQKAETMISPVGGSVEQLATGMTLLERSLGQVGSERATEALANLGITADRLISLPLDQKILLLSDGFRKARETGTGVADIMDLLGRGGKDLIGVLGLTREQLEGLANDAVLSETSGMIIDQLADAFNRYALAFKRLIQEQIASVIRLGKFLKDVWNVGLTKAYENMGADDLEAAIQKKASQSRKAKTASVDTARRAKEDAEKYQEEYDKALKEVKNQQEKLEQMRFELLPDEEKLGDLEARLQHIFNEAGGGAVQDLIDMAEMYRKYGDDKNADKYTEAAEKALALQKQITAEKDKGAKLEADALKEAQGKLTAADKEYNDKKAAIQQQRATSVVADSLTSIGGGGGGFAPGVDAQLRQLSVLEESRDYLKELVERLTSGGMSVSVA